MTVILKNILAGLASFPIVISLILGIGLASGVNSHFLLVSVIVTNVIGILLDSKNYTFYQLSVGLIVIFISMGYGNEISLSEPSLASLIMLLIPAFLFVMLSYVPLKFGRVPVSTIVAVSMGVGFTIIMKQVPYAFGISYPEEFMSLLSVNWLQFGLTLLIPVSAIMGEKYFGESRILLITFCLVSALAYFLPLEMQLYQLEGLNINQWGIQKWSMNSTQVLPVIVNGLTIFIVSICYFWGNYSVLSKYEISKDIDIKKSLRTIGLGNMISGFSGLFPVNIGLIESTAISTNKGDNKYSIYTLIILLCVCALIKIPDFYFPMFPVAGLLVWIGIRLILYSVKLLRGKHFLYALIGIIGCVIILTTDYIKGFFFSLICGLIYEAVIKVRGGAKNETSR